MANKKVGILTLHYGINYGGVLQTYATKETLKQLGYDPVILDRLPNTFSRKYPLTRKYAHPFTQRAFYQFRKYELQPISRPIFTSDELTALLKEDYYGIVIGSDQVWRKEVFSVDGDYYMIHQQDLPIRKVAYSASTGVAHWQYDEKETQQIKQALSKFDGLSVREAESVPVFKEHCGLDVKNILDPTLLAAPEIYTPLCKKAKLSGKGKLVTYMLDWTPEKIRIVLEAAKQTGLDVQHILPEVKKRRGLLSRIVTQDPSVYDWVNQIATADFVVTDSFHGMAFSTIFNRQFIVIGNPERGMARFTSLLNHFGISNRLIQRDLPNISKPIDYNQVNEKLNKLRVDGVKFLKQSLLNKKTQ